MAGCNTNSDPYDSTTGYSTTDATTSSGLSSTCYAITRSIGDAYDLYYMLDKMEAAVSNAQWAAFGIKKLQARQRPARPLIRKVFQRLRYDLRQPCWSRHRWRSLT